MKRELQRIFIRAEINKLWGSYSLQELLDKNRGDTVIRWALNKILERTGLREGEIVTTGHVVKMLELLEELHIPIVKLK